MFLTLLKFTSRACLSDFLGSLCVCAWTMIKGFSRFYSQFLCFHSFTILLFRNVCPSIHPSVHPSIDQWIDPSIHPSFAIRSYVLSIIHSFIFRQPFFIRSFIYYVASIYAERIPGNSKNFYTFSTEPWNSGPVVKLHRDCERKTDEDGYCKSQYGRFGYNILMQY